MRGRGVGQGSGQAGPGADPELRVCACQVVLDSSLSDEQCLGDLPVRLPGRCELPDPQFAGGKRVATPQRVAPGFASGDHEFLAGLAGEPEAALPEGEI